MVLNDFCAKYGKASREGRSVTLHNIFQKNFRKIYHSKTSLTGSSAYALSFPFSIGRKWTLYLIGLATLIMAEGDFGENWMNNLLLGT